MLTVSGETHIKRYLAGITPNICQSIAFGVGTSAESANSSRLDFEVGRETIRLVSFDYTTNKLIFKAPVSEVYSGKIYEVALYSSPADANAGDFGSRIISTFDPGTENWMVGTDGLVASTYTTDSARVGEDGLQQSPAAGSTSTDSLAEASLDLSGYSAADIFTVAINNGNANASAINLLFLTDTANYYTVNFGDAGAAGYKVLTTPKGSATPTGTPSWDNISEVRVQTTAAAGGAASVMFDGIRIEDTDTNNDEYIMVARDVLLTPFTKVAGTTQEIEYSLDVTI